MPYFGYKGKYKPKNYSKYEGDPTKIIYRSLLERKFMVHCDNNPNILMWSSEEVIIPYISPKDNKYHRYFMDFKVKYADKNGKIGVMLIEVKPSSKIQKPKPAKKSKRYIEEVFEWGVNEAKWKAASEYCKDRGWQFKIMTEKELR
jgi:hypothetical protein